MTANGALRLVVLGDSTAFTTDRGPVMPGDPAVYPSVVAAELERALGRPVATSVIARAGTDVRDAWRLVTKDRHVQFEVLMGADAVVVGIGSFDHAPAGVPPLVESLVPRLHSASLRRALRRALHAAHPHGVALTGARFPRTPRREFARVFDAVLFQVRALARGAAGVVLGPTGQDSPYYRRANPHREPGERAQFATAARHGFPTVACWPFVEPNLGRLNADGIHWPPDVHAAVGGALAAALAPQLTGARPKPPAPAWDGQAQGEGLRR